MVWGRVQARCGADAGAGHATGGAGGSRVRGQVGRRSMPDGLYERDALAWVEQQTIASDASQMGIVLNGCNSSGGLSVRIKIISALCS